MAFVPVSAFVDTRGNLTEAARLFLLGLVNAIAGVGHAASPGTSVQFNTGGNLDGTLDFTFDLAIGKLRVTSALGGGGVTGAFVVNEEGTGIGEGIITLYGVQNYQQLGFGIEDFVATDQLPAYLFKVATANKAAGVEVLTDEVVGDPLAYGKGVGFAVYVAPSAAGDNIFQVYQYGGLGVGAKAGMSIQVQRNDSGSGAASTLNLQQRSGTDYFLWFDALKRLRKGTGRPTEDNSVSDTSGTPVNDRMSNPPLTTPTNLEDGDSWMEASGVSPARTVVLYLRDAGVSVPLQTWVY